MNRNLFLRWYALVTCLVGTVFWVWAIVNSVRAAGGGAGGGGFPDAGVVTFFLAVLANLLLYRRVAVAVTDETTEKPPVVVVVVPGWIAAGVLVSGCLVALNYAGGLVLALGLAEPPAAGMMPQQQPQREEPPGIGFAIYCACFTAAWLAWTILGWCRMRTTTTTTTTTITTEEQPSSGGGTETA